MPALTSPVNDMGDVGLFDAEGVPRDLVTEGTRLDNTAPSVSVYASTLRACYIVSCSVGEVFPSGPKLKGSW